MWSSSYAPGSAPQQPGTFYGAQPPPPPQQQQQQYGAPVPGPPAQYGAPPPANGQAVYSQGQPAYAGYQPAQPHYGAPVPGQPAPYGAPPPANGQAAYPQGQPAYTGYQPAQPQPYQQYPPEQPILASMVSSNALGTKKLSINYYQDSRLPASAQQPQAPQYYQQQPQTPQYYQQQSQAPPVQHPGYGPAAPKAPATGRRKAVLIGINYTGTRNQLKGCVNDVRFIKHLLQTRFGFKDEDFFILTDEDPKISGVRRAAPTRYNIIDALRWLIGGVTAGDSLFFHFSGHGSQVRDTNGDEEDGYDETILPVDFQRAGQIVDDELHAILVKPLPAGARLTALIDACHSGTGLDLPYVMDVDQYDPSAVAASGYGRGAQQRGGGNERGLIGAMIGAGLMASASYGAPPPNKRKKYQKKVPLAPACAGDAVLFSGCDDHQTSADTSGLSGGTSTGAMTYCFVEAIEHGSVSDWHQYTYGSLLSTMRSKLLKKGYKQRPQLSSGKPMSASTPFRI
ncbi:Metacaspase-1 [Porphyridium purpureum]|uniref:Metacaspase-1 n=1 Tax=Porphyridium purpureum TaxID=35688 RepID=A0A5J4YUY6_PORPP|nr:Metacaspase-1 [Porphyridium purpureum]|eukprot:POR0494..scf227_4